MSNIVRVWCYLCVIHLVASTFCNDYIMFIDGTHYSSYYEGNFPVYALSTLSLNRLCIHQFSYNYELPNNGIFEVPSSNRNEVGMVYLLYTFDITEGFTSTFMWRYRIQLQLIIAELIILHSETLPIMS